MDNISKRVISLSENKIVGFVLSLYIDYENKRKVGYIIVDDETEQEYLLENGDIKYATDCIMIETSSVLKLWQEDVEFKKEVFTERGEYLGRVCSLKFDGSMLRKIYTERAEVAARFIKTFGDKILIVAFKKKRAKFPRFSNESLKVSLMEGEIETSQKLTLSFSHYAEKVATKTLLGINHEVVVRQGEKITKQVFLKAKKHNKLNELYFIAKD